MHASIVAALAFVATIVAVPVRAADEPDELVPGRIVIIKNGKLAKFVAKPPTGMTFDLPDATNDPTAEGGLLEVFDNDPFRPVSADFALPSSGWKGLGNPAGSKGYKYTGAGSPSDPCRVVLVKPAVVKAVCKGSGVTLPTPFTGQVGIVLTVGTDSKRYCAVFGGDETKNDPTVLKRKNAPAPNTCPLDLNSSTTIPPTTSTSTTSSTSVTAPVCPTTTTLGIPDCGPGPACGLPCLSGQACVDPGDGQCACAGPVLCGGTYHTCGSACSAGTCAERPVPPGCPSIGCECQ